MNFLVTIHRRDQQLLLFYKIRKNFVVDHEYRLHLSLMNESKGARKEKKSKKGTQKYRLLKLQIYKGEIGRKWGRGDNCQGNYCTMFSERKKKKKKKQEKELGEGMEEKEEKRENLDRESLFVEVLQNHKAP